MPTLLVLGANSFSGQDFVDHALDSPRFDRVVGVSRSAERSPAFLRYRRRSAGDLARYAYHALDLNRDMERILSLLDELRPTHIVNFAAQSEVAPSWDHPEHWFATNTVALARLVNHLRRRDYLERYLHISSPEVYGSCVGRVSEDAAMNPSTPYAASKAAADLLLGTYHRQFGFPLLTVRATNVYGAGQQLFKIIPRTVIYMKVGRRVPLHGGGRAVKSFIHIRDVSRGEWSILERGEVGRLYHLSPVAGVAVREVVARLASAAGKRLEEVAEMVEERPGQDAAYVIDSTLARTSLGWEPRVTLEEGLGEVVGWVERYWSEIERAEHGYVHRA